MKIFGTVLASKGNSGRNATHLLPGTCSHDVNQICELVVMLPGGHQPLQDQDFEVFKHVASLTAHHLHIKKKKNRLQFMFICLYNDEEVMPCEYLPQQTPA